MTTRRDLDRLERRLARLEGKVVRPEDQVIRPLMLQYLNNDAERSLLLRVVEAARQRRKPTKVSKLAQILELSPKEAMNAAGMWQYLQGQCIVCIPEKLSIEAWQARMNGISVVSTYTWFGDENRTYIPNAVEIMGQEENHHSNS
ncbi:MAG: hypothetical protein AAF629_01260 [Chloroflexota bacterium]